MIARRGQGIYRSNVRLVEGSSRITGLDGHNGLLLSPHIDHLFDKGFISFTNQGGLKVSKHLHEQVLAKWHLDKSQQVGRFSGEQSKYLEYHRDEIFEKGLFKAK